MSGKNGRNGHSNGHGKLAVGSHQGNVRRPRALARGLDALIPSCEPDPLAVARAQRDCALDLLRSLERMVTRMCGYMPHDDQLVLRETRALLVESGRIPRGNELSWVDRET